MYIVSFLTFFGTFLSQVTVVTNYKPGKATVVKNVESVIKAQMLKWQ